MHDVDCPHAISRGEREQVQRGELEIRRLLWSRGQPQSGRRIKEPNMRKMNLRVLFLGLALVCWALPAQGDAHAPHAVFAGFPVLNSYMSVGGWQADVATNLSPKFGIAGNVAGDYIPRSDVRSYTFTAGPRLTLRRNKVDV